MYDGKVFVEGATSATALYDVTSRTWSAGPTFPVVGGRGRCRVRGDNLTGNPSRRREEAPPVAPLVGPTPSRA